MLKNIYNYGGFRESSNAQLVPIRQLELFKDRGKIETDDAHGRRREDARRSPRSTASWPS